MKKLAFFLTIMLIAFLLLVNSIVQPIYGYIDKSELPELQVNVERIESDVRALADTPTPRNYKNIDALNAAAAYITQEFELLGKHVTEQKYEVEGTEYKNLMCSFGPAEAPRLIVGAHYDVCGEQAGADDNASGVAGLLKLARMLKQNTPELEYRIDLVAYTLEEPPFFRTEDMGSHVHAKSLSEQRIDVKGMISLEMIGYFSEEKGSQEYPVGALKPFYPNTGNFIAVVGKFGQGKFTRRIKRRMQEGGSVDVVSINAPASIQGIDFSDHLNYWKYDFEAVMITNTAFFRNKNYHQPTDVPETLNYRVMAEVIKGAYWAIVNGY